MTVGQWLRTAERRLADGDIWGGRLDSQLILAHVLKRPKEWLLAHPEAELADDQIRTADRLIDRRIGHEPVVHLTNHKEFYGLDFEITPDVLTPRAETEPMIEWAAHRLPQGAKVIDIGTGSGALAVALSVNRPDLELTATDVSGAALEVARRNALRHDAAIRFFQADIWEGVSGCFDAILTNLPYLTDDADITQEVKREPAVALFGGPDGLGLYRRMLAGSPAHLNPDGFLFTECDPWQQEELAATAARFGFEKIEESYFVMGFQMKKQPS